MSAAEPAKWYKYTSQVQQAINAHVHASTSFTPFEVMFSKRMRNNSSPELLRFLQDEMLVNLQDKRNQIWQEARLQIKKAQDNYKKNYDKKRKNHHGFQLGDLVAIKMTQFIAGRKLAKKYIGPYEVIQVKRNSRYDVKKAADFEGPLQTSTSADFMKLWRYADLEEDDDLSDEEAEASGTDVLQDGRM
ncbi:uncharacterized protein LOC122319804 [Drosophila ficusphila]|uniref:uncharacterized protein LOC122319804 n=1 Tax=Drosophila ficusphila TaxID=30025 RepID=UPI001C892CD4|nr:uncharacterized protein LOC122319804 [Drosophila ficusphila]